MATGPTGADGTASYAYLTARAFGADADQVGFGGTGITVPFGSGGVPSASQTFPDNFSGSPVDPNFVPEVVVVNEGTNDVAASSAQFEPAYQAYLAEIRSAYPAAWILAMRPFNGTHAADIQAAVTALADARIDYVDTTNWLTAADFTDGTHPNTVGDAIAAAHLTALVASVTGLKPLPMVMTFGAPGTGAGELNDPSGIAVDATDLTATTGHVYVADSGNDRVDVFTRSGTFLRAWGWGVGDGAATLEVCTSVCQSGLAGNGVGELTEPSSIAVDDSSDSSSGDVYVGAKHTVTEFSPDGELVNEITGPAPGAIFGSVAAITVDGNGDIWVVDGSTNTVYEFDPGGSLETEFSDGYSGTRAIASDGGDGVFLTDGNGITEHWNAAAIAAGPGNGQVVTSRPAAALSTDTDQDDLYVDENDGSISEYGPGGELLGNFGAGALGTSTGVAVAPEIELAGAGGAGTVYSSDGTGDDIVVFEAPNPSEPSVLSNGYGATEITPSAATLDARLDGDGMPTQYYFEYVQSSLYDAAAGDPYAGGDETPGVGSEVPAAPGIDLGSNYFGVTPVSVYLTGLNPGTTYDFRVVAANALGTEYGPNAIFTTSSAAGPGAGAAPPAGGAAAVSVLGSSGSSSSGIVPSPAGPNSIRAPRADVLWIRPVGAEVDVRISCSAQAGEDCRVVAALISGLVRAAVAGHPELSATTARTSPSTTLTQARVTIGPQRSATIRIRMRRSHRSGPPPQVWLRVTQMVGGRTVMLVRQQISLR